MPTIQIDTIKNDYPGKKDHELAAILAEKYHYQVIVRFKHPSSNDYDHFGCCFTVDQTDGYMKNSNCKDPEIIFPLDSSKNKWWQFWK